MSAPTPSLTPSELRRNWRTVAYETQMLAGTAEYLSSPKIVQYAIVKNALVESFAIHSRALIFFLYWDATYKNQRLFRARPISTDVVATDFFAGATWNSRPPLTATLVRAKFQADKQIAHITRARQALNGASGRGKVWRFGLIHLHLSRAMQSFLNAAPAIDDKMRTCVEPYLRRQ